MWDAEIKDLGDVQATVKQTIVYTYTGDKKIKSVRTSCGCTVASYPKTDTGYTINAQFTPKHSSKDYKKNGSITVTFTDNIIKILKFKSNVKTNNGPGN